MGSVVDSGFFSTVTVHVAVSLLNAVTEIFAVPSFNPVTMPFLSTFAIFLLLLFQVSLYDADLLESFAFSCTVLPTCTVASLNFTSLGSAFTFTFSEAVFPFCVSTVIVVEDPAFLPVIIPPLSTVATFEFLLFHVYFGFAPLLTSGLIVTDSPLPMVMDFIGKETVAGSLLTVTVQVALLPLKVVTVIFVLPFLTPVTTPFSSTVAIFLFLLFQVSLFDAVLSGRTATSWNVSVAGSVSFLFDNETEPGAFLTVTLQV